MGFEGGEFFTHLRRCKRFENDQAKFYAAMIVDIFDYLHTDNIIYRRGQEEFLPLARRVVRAALSSAQSRVYACMRSSSGT